MDIVERGRACLQGLRALAGRKAWEWRRCPHCGETETRKWGELPATAVVLAWAGDGAGAAAPVFWLWPDVLGAVGAAGAWWVVRA
jgi:hypothetical protein